MKLANIQVLLLRLAVGALFLTLVIDKYNEGWLTNSEPLRTSLTGYQQHAGEWQLKYLEQVAIPYAGVWSKLILIGEGCLALSLLLGMLVRFTSTAGLFMLLNFYAANGSLFSWKFFSSPYGGLLFASLWVFLLARAGRWAGIDSIFATSNAKAIWW
jgi:uncharacterized membrane protein YphA (DoxX/SURF4 family)